MHTFKLLGQRKFAPLFWVQFCGAFNDNLFKNALVLFIALRATSEAESGFFINMASGLFILPFILFAAIAGQLADKFEKSMLIRYTKVFEIGIMAMGAIALYLHKFELLLGVLFLLGTHSSIFGPLKYSILPQHLAEDELIAGNGLVEMGTFLAILLGTISAGLLLEHGHQYVATAILAVSVCGWWFSRYIPEAPASDPQLKLTKNPLPETKNLMSLAMAQKTVFLSILGISWFWFFGATILAQLPSFTKFVLFGNEQIVTLLLATFSISIGVGSMLCERLSRGDVEIGMVPFGAAGMTWFCLDLFLMTYPPAGDLVGLSAFLETRGDFSPIRLLMDVGGIGLFGSFFIVPLYALIQQRSDERYRSRIVAANNLMNSLFMVASALMTMVLYNLGASTPEIFLTIAVLNLAVCTYIFALVPEFALRFGFWLLASTIYHLRYDGREHLPRRGAALLVCNHVSFIDWLVITAACNRPVRFVMDHRIFAAQGVNFIFKLCKAIPIAPAKESAEVKEKAFLAISDALRDDQVVCIFPEGMITHDGKLNAFKPGVERILAADPVPVIAMAIGGLWGSFFSRKNGPAMKKIPKPTHRTISVYVAPPLIVPPKASQLEVIVSEMLVAHEARKKAA
ncbi:MAG: MFS transporter [Deltaproteobacteria bacterium]|nr:MFS transporter [Deltaproteobacteria bacterium]